MYNVLIVKGCHTHLVVSFLNALGNLTCPPNMLRLKCLTGFQNVNMHQQMQRFLLIENVTFHNISITTIEGYKNFNESSKILEEWWRIGLIRIIKLPQTFDGRE